MTIEMILMISLVGVVAIMLIMLVNLSGKLKKLQQQLNLSASSIEQNQQSIRALFSGAAGVGDHITQIEMLMRRISERQDQLDLKDSSSQSYDHAIRLIQSGADYDEIISRCGLVKEEADLLVQMYRYDKTA